MILKVNPTRVNLLTLKRRLKTATKGHKLLKDKRDGLIQRFMAIIKETRELRARVDEELGDALRSYVRAAATVNGKMLDLALLRPESNLSLQVQTESVMSVPTPRFTFQQEGQGFSYGFLETSAELDSAIRKLGRILPEMVRLAELEKTIENLAGEIERTRRRTNALEFVMIPNLEETISYINLRLEEQQRDAVVSNMRVKEMISS